MTTKKTDEIDGLLKQSWGYKKDTPLLLQFGRRRKPQDFGTQLQIAKTARKGKSCQISYTKLDDTFGVYDVQRYSFRQYKGVTYFYGWDLHDNQIKSFVAIRISNVSELDVPHQRLWIVQMGNDPQQVKYWKRQQKKTRRQKRAERANKTAADRGQKAAEDAARQRQPVIKDVSWITRYLPPTGVKPGLQPPPRPEGVTPQIARDVRAARRQGQAAQRQAGPVIKTITRQTTSFTVPPGQTGPKSPKGPTKFGIV